MFLLCWDYKKIPYELKAINLLEGEHQKEDYLKKNPLGRVPSLEIEGHHLSESTGGAFDISGPGCKHGLNSSGTRLGSLKQF